MSVYRTTQWILVNDALLTCFSIFSESQATIKFLSSFVYNSRIVREYRLLSGRFTIVSLVWVPGHCSLPGNCISEELAGAEALLLESSSIQLAVPLGSVKLAIKRKFL